MRLSAKVGEYIGGLVIGQGRKAGDSFELLSWQRRFLRGAFGQDGDAALSMARGGGKTTFVAGIACAAVDVGGPLVQPMGECLLVASSFDQGLIGFRHVLGFLRPSLERYGVGPGGRFRVQDSANRATVQDRQTGALLRVLGSDPRRLHGAAPALLLLDEIAQWPPERVGPMLAALRTSPGARFQGQSGAVAGYKAEPLTEHPFQRALDGVGDGVFPLCYAGAQKMPIHSRPATWKKANPSLPYMPDLLAVIKLRSRQEAKTDAGACSRVSGR